VFVACLRGLVRSLGETEAIFFSNVVLTYSRFVSNNSSRCAFICKLCVSRCFFSRHFLEDSRLAVRFDAHHFPLDFFRIGEVVVDFVLAIVEVIRIGLDTPQVFDCRVTALASVAMIKQ
jgi:hypothetical protein